MPEEEEWFEPTLGGMLYYHPDTPAEIAEQYDMPEGQEYLRNMNNLLGLLNSSTPDEYVWKNNSAWRDWGKAHPKKPSHDLVLRRADDIDSDGPPPELSEQLQGVYEDGMRIAQSIGMRAKGTKHGTGPHLHLNSGKTKAKGMDTEKYLESMRSRFMSRTYEYRGGGLIRDAYGRTLF